MTAPARAIVAGGGIAGSTIALELARRGASAVVVEPRAAIGGATGAAAGILAPRFETDPEDPLFPLLLAARRGYGAFLRRLEALGGGGFDFREDGLVIVNRDPKETGAAAEAAARYRAFGLGGEVREPGAARELVGGLGDVDSVLWLEGEASVDSQALAPALERAARAAGVTCRRGRVEALDVDGGSVRGVLLEDGARIRADLVFLAAGAWSGRIGGADLPAAIRPVRGQMLRLRGLRPPLARQVADHDGRYALPRRDGSVVVGSTMEEAGFEERPTEAAIATIRERVARWLPAVADATTVETWAGLRPFAPDGLPVLGPDPSVAGLHHATGYARNGILIAPRAAELTVGIALGDALGADERDLLARFAPDRFA